jgi:HAD superfamily hydrolase (TIGR01509 family)
MAEIEAIIFDQDGVIIDTERDGHRVAFNETFKEFGFNVEWDVDKYHKLLQIAGGKERMKHHLQTEGFGVPVKPDQVDDLIRRLHRRKTEIFVELIDTGKLPLRPGVKRLMTEAMDKGLILGVCTTSNEKAAHTVAYQILKDIKFNFVLAGDIVSRKKPDPEIYLLALEKTGLEPEQCVVIEDSRNGVLAAKAASMHVVATTNVYTEKEDLSQADIIVTCLGEPDGEKGTLKQGGRDLDFDGVLHIDRLMEYFSKGD